jgi:hypothetical protein
VLSSIRLVVAPGSSVLRSFVFGSSGCSSKGGKGWRLFMIADAWASFVRLVGRGADEREKGNPAIHGPKARGPQGKDRPIDPTSGKNATPLKIARTGFELVPSGRAPALHALEYLKTPAFEDLSLPFRSCEADAAAFHRARENAFHPPTAHNTSVLSFCKAVS